MAVLAAVAVIWTVGYQEVGTGYPGYDMRYAYLHGARAVLDGESPYPEPGGRAFYEDKAYVYPPLFAYLVTPFTLLPDGAAVVVAGLLSGALLLASLWLLGVRDPLCYPAALLWAPTQVAIYNASISAVLPFAVAVAWRYRHTMWPLAATLGLTVAAKLFLWPLLVWAAAGGRVRASAYAVAIGVAATLVTWGAIGFAGFAGYPDLLRFLQDLNAERGYSPIGVLRSLGVGDELAVAVAVAIGGALLLAAIVLARRGEDAGALTLALGAALALSPIVWQHYLVLLLVPMAILRPRFSVLWLLPVLLWLSPRSNSNGDGLEPFIPLLVASIVIVVLVLPILRRTRVDVAPR